MRNSDHPFRTVTGILVLIAVLSVGFYLFKPQSVQSAGSHVGMQSLAEKTVQTILPDTAEKKLLDTQNDITVQLTSSRVILTGLELGICYTTPDNGEWRPLPGHLFYGQYEIYPDEIEFLEGEKLADGKRTGTRCTRIRYRIDDLNTITTPIEFSILQFYVAGREMYTPCQEIQRRLETSPRAQNYRLRAECLETDGNISISLLSHSEAITTQMATDLLNEIAKGEMEGPWVFTIDQLER